MRAAGRDIAELSEDALEEFYAEGGAAQVWTTILPAQQQMLEDVTSKTIVFVAGWGSGKTRGMALKAISLGLLNPGLPILYVMPSYGQIEDVALETFREIFAEWGMIEGLDYTYRAKRPSLTAFFAAGTVRIWLRSSDRPSSLLGPNVAAAIIDEAEDHRESAANNIASRVRHPSAKVLQVVAGGTPEQIGGWFHTWAEGDAETDKSANPVVQMIRKSRTTIRAKTDDNVFLPEGFIESRLAHLDPVAQAKYRRGEFVAMGGRVYSALDPDVHLQTCEQPEAGQQWMSCDFGKGIMAWGFGRTIDDVMHLHGEQVLEEHDTGKCVDLAVEWWRKFFARHGEQGLSLYQVTGRVKVFCDPAGQEAHGKSDIRLLQQAGFEVYHRYKHPLVRDRVNAMQTKLRNRELFLDEMAAPYFAKCLRYQVYDPKTGAPAKARGREGRKGLDHGSDALGYAVEYEYPAALQHGNFHQYGRSP